MFLAIIPSVLVKLGMYFWYSPIGIALKGVGNTNGPYLVVMILSILVGACGAAMDVVDMKVLEAWTTEGWGGADMTKGVWWTRGEDLFGLTMKEESKE